MITYVKYRSSAGPNVDVTKRLFALCSVDFRMCVCVFALCISCFMSSSWTCIISQLVLKTLFPPPPLLHAKAGISGGAPGLCLSEIPCLSLKSVETNTCSGTGFESRDRSYFSPSWCIVCWQRLQGRCSLLLLVEIAPIAHIWSPRIFLPTSQRWSSEQPRGCRTIPPISASLCMVPAQWKPKRNNVRKRHRRFKLCNWFSKPESSEVAVHVGLNCDLRLYWHSYRRLPVLQPERTEQAKPRWKGALCHEGALFSILGSDEGLFVLTGQPVSEGHTPHL